MAESEHDLLQQKAKSLRSNFEEAETADQIAEMEDKIKVMLWKISDACP